MISTFIILLWNYDKYIHDIIVHLLEIMKALCHFSLSLCVFVCLSVCPWTKVRSHSSCFDSVIAQILFIPNVMTKINKLSCIGNGLAHRLRGMWWSTNAVLTLMYGKGHGSRTKVTHVKMYGFSECFLVPSEFTHDLSYIEPGYMGNRENWERIKKI